MFKSMEYHRSFQRMLLPWPFSRQAIASAEVDLQICARFAFGMNDFDLCTIHSYVYLYKYRKSEREVLNESETGQNGKRKCLRHLIAKTYSGNSIFSCYFHLQNAKQRCVRLIPPTASDWCHHLHSGYLITQHTITHSHVSRKQKLFFTVCYCSGWPRHQLRLRHLYTEWNTVSRKKNLFCTCMKAMPFAVCKPFTLLYILYMSNCIIRIEVNTFHPFHRQHDIWSKTNAIAIDLSCKYPHTHTRPVYDVTNK